MSKKEVLVDIIHHLYAFDAENKGSNAYSTKDFAAYLNAQFFNDDLGMRKLGGEKEDWVYVEKQKQNTDIAILISLMYRYARIYIKKALADSLIQTADEFSFLINLITYDSLTKTELINKQVLEKTSGVEVIKRLVKQNLIQEFADQEDRRSVRVSITAEGKNEIIKVLPTMGMVSKIVLGDLNNSEIETLSYILKKLDHCHNDIFMNKRNLNLEELNSFLSQKSEAL